MRKAVLLLALGSASAWAQSGPPKEAIDITHDQIATVLKGAPPKVDQQIRVVDMGKYNLAVGVVHRGPTKDDGVNIGGIAHDATTETYIIISGTGTLVTGGTVQNGRRSAPDSEVTKILNGPSVSGVAKDGVSRKVVPGDVIVIPAGVFHGWTGITDHVDYLSVRPDLDKVLPSGYVNPAIASK